jgi:ribosomal protein L11 methyltransferase
VGGSWKVSAVAGRAVVLSALAAQEELIDWDPAITLAASEADSSEPEVWKLEAWFPRKPDKADRTTIAGLFADAAPSLTVQRLPETDWVVESQKGLAPIRAGRFHVHTAEHAPSDEPDTVNFLIPASQAFGTGQHETTSGCLAMLEVMKQRGVVVRDYADIGTGTGLLAFAALSLWPNAYATATDIDPVCGPVLAENAELNNVRLGTRRGEVLVVIADGMDDELIDTRAPFDLIIANILAGPLIELAPDFADALAPGGHLLLSGLLTSQEQQVRAACFRAGLRLAARATQGEWSILWLRRRALR